LPIITSYLYENKFTVQILEDDPTIKTRNRVVYQRPIEIYRGADNPVTIYFKNQDQKAANIAGVTFQGYIIDYLKGNVVANVAVTVSNVSAATANVMLTDSFLNTLPQNKYKLAFLQNDGTYETPTYSNDNFGVYAELNINPAFETDAFTSSTTDYSGNVDLGII
jgi:uncharacterized membrane protein YkgB